MTIPFKKSLKSLAFCAVAVLTTTAFTSPTFAQANVANAEERFSVDIKDATLLDALELVFMAAGNPSRNIDPSAKSVRLGVVSFKNQPWRDIVRTLTNLNQFRFSRRDNVWIVEPRLRNASVGDTFLTSIRTNASVDNVAADAKSKARGTADFSKFVRSSPQFGGQQGQQGQTNTLTVLPSPTAIDSKNPWTIIEPNHTYAGALALFFAGGTVFSTEEQVVPSSWGRRSIFPTGDFGVTSGTNGNNTGETNR